MLAAIEMATGVGPEQFMSPRERADFLDAAMVERRHKAEVDRLYELERRSRWQGDALTADEVRRIGSVEQTLTEMGRGERFVVDYFALARASASAGTWVCRSRRWGFWGWASLPGRPAPAGDCPS